MLHYEKASISALRIMAEISDADLGGAGSAFRRGARRHCCRRRQPPRSDQAQQVVLRYPGVPFGSTSRSRSNSDTVPPRASQAAANWASLYSISITFLP